MRLYSKLFIGALAATALFASLATSASARNLSISNRNIRTAFAPLRFGSESLTISCNVTLEGTFHSNTINKVINSLVGYITRATVDTPRCSDSSGGTARALVRQESLPWHIRYVGFIGTLPNVRVRLQLINATFRLLGLPFGLSCDYRASPFGIVEGPAAGTNINTGNAFLRAEEGQSFESSSSFLCPRGFFQGRGAVTLLGTTTPITVRLI
jgi:hypothetical protein